MVMLPHKHCRRCGEIIVPGYLLDVPIDIHSRVDNNIAYESNFCTICIENYSLDYLKKWWKRRMR